MSRDPLLQLIWDRIQTGGGWLPFDAFMAEALYAPNLGYYTRPQSPIGLLPQDGSDFTTAPEMSPLFARALARQLAQALGVSGTRTIYEFGAGSGALAAQLLDELAALLPEVEVEYRIAELSASLRARQRERLSRFSGRVQWMDVLPDEFVGVVIGNEVLDAMPVKLLHFDGHQWLERGLQRSDACLAQHDSGLRWSDRPTGLRPPYQGTQWIPGTVTEIHQQACAWTQSVGRRLTRGSIFLIDYGFGEAEYYHPQRAAGTLMCHCRHRADPDPLQDVGSKDLTAHVNFTAVALAGQDVGLEVLGYTGQGRFLLNCGIANDLARSSLPDRVMGQRLVNEHEMGELFKVLAFSKPGEAFDALGFQLGDRTHRL